MSSVNLDSSQLARPSSKTHRDSRVKTVSLMIVSLIMGTLFAAAVVNAQQPDNTNYRLKSEIVIDANQSAL